MTRDDPFLDDIERDEAWLREQIADPAFDVEATKRAAEIGLGERWLASQMRDKVRSELVADLQRRIRAELAPQKKGRANVRSTRRRLVYSLLKLGGGAGAVAACLFVAFMMRQSRVSTPTISYLSAFEEYEPYELNPDLTSLRDEVKTLASGSTTAASADDDYESLRNSIDRLYSNSGSNDWS